MKILIVDNEAEIRSVIRSLVETHCDAMDQIEEAEGVASGLALIRQFHPDLLLLDVEMNDGTGFDLLKQVPDPRFQLIFTTAHNQYAIQAIKYSALDYLLKPVDPEELALSLKKARGQLNHLNVQQQLNILLSQLGNKPLAEQQIVVRDIDKTYFLRITDILYCEAEGSYTKFYLSNAEPIFVSRNLRYYEELLAPSGFFRTHHSCLVNPQKIRIYDRKTDSGTLILEGGHSIPVSQRKKELVLQLLEGRKTG